MRKKIFILAGVLLISFLVFLTVSYVVAGNLSTPSPATTDYDLTVMTWNMWKEGTHAGWEAMMEYPDRKPLMGWYDEGDSEVNDWEIKWWVEHGIKNALFSWYRHGDLDRSVTETGDPYGSDVMLGHNIESFDSSSYKDYIDYAIAWGGADAGVADQDDLVDNVCDYWITNYFNDSNYLIKDNKPVVFIFRYTRFIDIFGSKTNFKTALDACRTEAINNGFSGIYFIANEIDNIEQELNDVKDCGFDYVSLYSNDKNVPEDSTPTEAVNAIMDFHETRESMDILPQIPVVTNKRIEGIGDWEGAGWATFRYDMGSYDFRQLLAQMKNFMDNTIPSSELGHKMLFLDNWNEYGEGHSFAPDEKYGFAFLDAIAEVFTTSAPSENILPDYRLDERMRKPMLAYWSLDEASGTTANDLSGWDHDATTVGSPSWSTSGGKIRGALEFDGTDDYLRLAPNDTSDFLHETTCVRSIAMWIKPDTVTGVKQLYDEGNSRNGIALRINNGIVEGRVRYTQDIIPTPNPAGPTPTPNPIPTPNVSEDTVNISISSGQWTHIALVYDRLGGLMLYKNGDLVSSVTDMNTGKIYPHNNIASAGARYGSDVFDGSSTGVYYDGLIDDLRIYCSGLELEEIEGLYSAYNCSAYYKLDESSGNASDSSDNNHTGTLYGGTWQTSGGYLDGALEFDGTNDYVELTGFKDSGFLHDRLQRRNITLRVKADNTSGTNVIYDEGGIDNGLAIQIKNGVLEATATMDHNMTIVSTSYTSTSWNKIEVDFDQGDLRLLVNDEVKDSAITYMDIIPAHSNNAGLGACINEDAFGTSSTGNYFDGKIDEVYINSDSSSWRSPLNGWTAVDNESGDITYTGTWNNGYNIEDYEGSIRYNNTTDNKASFTFTGAGIKYYSRIASSLGKVQIKIDNSEVSGSPFDLYNSSTLCKQLIYEDTSLSPESHTIEVITTGTKNASASDDKIMLDYFEYYITPSPKPTSTPTPTPLGTTINSTSGSITYTGSWGVSTDASDYGGSVKTSNVINDKASFTFTGTGIKYYARKAPGMGDVQVKIDNIEVPGSPFDLYNSSRSYQQLIYEDNLLAPSAHTIDIICLHTKNASATDYYVNIDYFNYYSSPTPTPTSTPTPTATPLPTPTSTPTWTAVDSESGSITYTGTWDNGYDDDDYLGSIRYTNTSGNKASFTFTGTGIRYYAREAGTMGKVQVKIDGNEVAESPIDLYNSSRICEQLIYEHTSLISESHTIEIIWTGTKNTSSSDYKVDVDYFEYQ